MSAATVSRDKRELVVDIIGYRLSRTLTQWNLLWRRTVRCDRCSAADCCFYHPTGLTAVNVYPVPNQLAHMDLSQWVLAGENEWPWLPGVLKKWGLFILCPLLYQMKKKLNPRVVIGLVKLSYGYIKLTTQQAVGVKVALCYDCLPDCWTETVESAISYCFTGAHFVCILS